MKSQTQAPRNRCMGFMCANSCARSKIAGAPSRWTRYAHQSTPSTSAKPQVNMPVPSGDLLVSLADLRAIESWPSVLLSLARCAHSFDCRTMGVPLVVVRRTRAALADPALPVPLRSSRAPFAQLHGRSGQSGSPCDGPIEGRSQQRPGTWRII